MKGIILAAGIGSRMKKAGQEKPKCLIEINGTPILIKQIKSLHKNNITDVSIVVGFKKELVKKICKEHLIKFYTNPNFETTGMLESLYCAKEELIDDFLLFYGDVYVEASVIRALLNNMDDFTIVVRKPGEITKSDDFETYHGLKLAKGATYVTIKNHRILEIGKSLKKISAEYIGIAKFSKTAAKVILKRIEYLIKSEEIKKYPSPSYLFQWLLSQNKSIGAVTASHNKVFEVDYPSDIVVAQKYFNKKIAAILFDAEDIIYYRDEETLKPILNFFKKYGYSITGQQFKKAYEKYKLDLYKGNISAKVHLKKILRQLKIECNEIFYNHFIKIFKESYSEIKVKVDIHEVFKKIKEKGIKIIILTDTHSSEEKKRLFFQKIKLEKYIDEIICSSTTGFTKESEKAFNIALRRIRVPSSQALFVGHASYEISGAKKANIKAVSTEKNIGEDIYIQSIDEILTLL